MCFGLLAAGSAEGAGPVVGWGDNTYGQTTPPASVNGTLGTASAIAAGVYHGCAIQSGTGAVVCWGSNYDEGAGGTRYTGQATPPTSVNGILGTASAIAAGVTHSCAIQSGTAAVVCWGSYPERPVAPPPSVNGTSGTASAIAAGSMQSCAVQSGTGAVVCWGGYNIYGESTPPASVNGTSGTASAIAAGEYHGCAIQSGTGAVVCWGSNELGRATPPDSVNGTSGTASTIAAG